MGKCSALDEHLPKEIIVSRRTLLCALSIASAGYGSCRLRAGSAQRPSIDGVGPGWRALGEADFADVNGNPETWQFRDGMIISTGKPIGVMRTTRRR
jgi:hypothetical protein